VNRFDLLWLAWNGTAGQLATLMRNNKRLYMRVHYSLIENSNVFFTFTTLNQMSPNEERGKASSCHVSCNTAVVVFVMFFVVFVFCTLFWCSHFSEHSWVLG